MKTILNASDLHNVLLVLEGYHDKRWREACKGSHEIVDNAAEAVIKQMRLVRENMVKVAFDEYRRALIVAAQPDTETLDEHVMPHDDNWRAPTASNIKEQGADDLNPDTVLCMLWHLWNPAASFTFRQREILTRLLVRKDSPQEIAKTVRPPMSGRGEVYREVDRMSKKLDELLHGTSVDAPKR
jgi:hypothetical protein